MKKKKLIDLPEIIDKNLYKTTPIINGNKMKIYISGKISGLPKNVVEEKFKWHAEFLELKGYEPINPIEVSPFEKSKKWIDYMIDDVTALLKCDAIYMLKDWQESKGARLEHTIAKEAGLHIFYEGIFNK